MGQHEEDLTAPSAWKKYFQPVVLFLAYFYLSSVALIMLIKFRPDHSVVLVAGAAFVYLIAFFYAAFSMVRQLSLAAVMLAAPTVPLILLIMAVSLIPFTSFLTRVAASYGYVAKPIIFIPPALKDHLGVHAHEYTRVNEHFMNDLRSLRV
jgi:hypothetical protein